MHKELAPTLDFIFSGKRLSINSVVNERVSVFTPSNIALAKYWGKRNEFLKLPVADSLSISLGSYGVTTDVELAEHDSIEVNGKLEPNDSNFAKRLFSYLDLFRKPELKFKIRTSLNIPIAAGLASSAAGFAALAKCLGGMFGITDLKQLSILARIGSGSAARSIYDGFVYWHAGVRADGLDSYAERIDACLPELCVGILVVSEDKKLVSSTEAMRDLMTSPIAVNWCSFSMSCANDLKDMIMAKDLDGIISLSEQSATMMHNIISSGSKNYSYDIPATLQIKEQIMKLRQEGLPVYFTQDAGPNLKLLFHKKYIKDIITYFPQVKILRTFDDAVSTS